MTAPQSHSDFADVARHLKNVTSELTGMHAELYWLAMQSGSEPDAAALDVELLADLKAAVDNMRILLWKYIETASQTNPSEIQGTLDATRMRRVSEFLQMLRSRLGGISEQQPHPVSFIEQIDAKVTERLEQSAA